MSLARVEIGDDLLFGDVDDQARPFFEFAAVAFHDVGHRDLDQRVDRDVDREPQIDAELGEIEARIERLIQRLFGQRDQVALAGAGHECAGHQHAVARVARAGKGFGADELFFAQVDLRLIPELDPAVAQCVVRDRRGRRPPADRRACSSCRTFRITLVSNGFLRTGQHAQMMLLADAFDMGKHGRAAVAHELHGAGIAGARQREDAFDGVGQFERDVEEDELRLCAGSAPAALPGRREALRYRCRRRAGPATENAGCWRRCRRRSKAVRGPRRWTRRPRLSRQCWLIARVSRPFPDPRRQRDGSRHHWWKFVNCRFRRRRGRMPPPDAAKQARRLCACHPHDPCNGGALPLW